MTREVRDPATGAVKVPADYSQLGDLLIVTVALGLALPFLAILFPPHPLPQRLTGQPCRGFS